MRRRPQQALTALRRLRGPSHDCAAELAELEHFSRDVLQRRVRPSEALRPPYIGPILIVAGLFFFQPASGNDALTYFTVDILDAADSSLEPHTASILASAMWIPATLVAAVLADRAGRRPLLLASSCPHRRLHGRPGRLLLPARRWPRRQRLQLAAAGRPDRLQPGVPRRSGHGALDLDRWV